MKITNKPFPQKCTITSDRYAINEACNNVGACGYKIFDKNGELLGVVIAEPKDNNRAVIRFLNELKGKYGVWHLIQKDFSFSHLTKVLENKNVLEILVQ